MIDVSRILEIHELAVGRWHEQSVDQPFDSIYGMVCQQHSFNFRLWHEEDIARCPDATDDQIATVKRSIDRLNQQRNDWIEKIDDWITGDVAELRVSASEVAPLNTETPGSAIDRLSILALRLYHLEEQTERSTGDTVLEVTVGRKLEIGRLQRADLSQSLRELLDDIYGGRKRHQTYRQMKMYNDPKLNPYLIAAETRRKAG